MIGYIQCYSGRRFWPLEPRTQDINLIDIAHALSQQCRFAGHTTMFYSVAEHSVRVSEVCESQDVLWGLLHDASEAYLVDVPTPLKVQAEFEGYREAEKKVMRAVCDKFHLPHEMPPSVARADGILLATEVRDLMAPKAENWTGLLEKPLERRIVPWSPKEAKDRFMKRFQEILCPGA